jgi:hypothetical protein
MAAPIELEVAEARRFAAGAFVVRFWCAFFVLFLFPFPLDQFGPIGAAKNAAWNAISAFVARHVFRLSDLGPLADNGSGDRLIDYAQLFCIAVLALVAAAIWSWRGSSHRRALALTRLYVCWGLGLFSISYGLDKVAGLQMPAPNNARLIEPFGQASPMGLLWTFMGQSPGYECFAGLAEVVGGSLLLLRRTTLAGALLLTGVYANVAALNFFYDVPVKIFSSTLLAMSIFLWAPDARRLFGAIFAPVEDSLFTSRLARRVALGVGLLLVCAFAYNEFTSLSAFRKNLPTGAGLSGIYKVEASSEGWHEVAIDDYGTRVALSVLRDDDSMQRMWLALDEQKKSFTATSRFGPEALTGTYSQPEPGTLILEGEKLHAKLRRLPDAHFPLRDRGFHWVNPMPYNR